MSGHIAVYPGSFDPITQGHLDIIRRAAGLYDKLIVVAMTNSKKQYTFSAEERIDMIKKSTADIENVSVDYYGGLLADYTEQKNARVIIKGLRAMSDFEYEFQMALANKKMNPNVETVFLTTSAENMFLSSSMVKQIAAMGGNISGFVPEAISSEITKRLRAENKEG